MNISRYILEGQGSEQRETKTKTLADKWILSRLHQTIAKVTAAFEGQEFSAAIETLRDFTWSDLADWYLEVSKIEKNKEVILLDILEKVLKLWHPFIPFVTEAVWREFNAEDLLLIAPWPKSEKKLIDIKVEKDFARLQEIITASRNLRAENKIEPVQKVRLVIKADKKLAALIEAQSEVIKFLARLSELDLIEAGKVEQAASAVVSGVEIYLPLAGLIDLGKEKNRLAKEVAELEKYLTGLISRLDNKEFVANAPATVVEKEKLKLAESQSKLEKLRHQLQTLK